MLELSDYVPCQVGWYTSHFERKESWQERYTLLHGWRFISNSRITKTDRLSETMRIVYSSPKSLSSSSVSSIYCEFLSLLWYGASICLVFPILNHYYRTHLAPPHIPQFVLVSLSNHAIIKFLSQEARESQIQWYLWENPKHQSWFQSKYDRCAKYIFQR